MRVTYGTSSLPNVNNSNNTFIGEKALNGSCSIHTQNIIKYNRRYNMYSTNKPSCARPFIHRINNSCQGYGAPRHARAAYFIKAQLRVGNPVLQRFFILRLFIFCYGSYYKNLTIGFCCIFH